MKRLLLLAAPLLLAAAPAGDAAFEAAVARTKQSMMRDPAAALDSAKQAVAIAAAMPASSRADVNRITADWLHGEALMFMNDLHAATPIIDGALARAQRLAPNTKLHGDLLRSRGAIMAWTGKITSALQLYQRAFEVFRRAGESRAQAMALQDMGQIYSEAGDQNRALFYYAQAIATHHADHALTLTIHNNRAESFRKLGRHDDASASYRLALVAARQLGSPMLLARIYTNLAGSEAEAGRLAAADDAVKQAMRFADHGEAAGWRPFVLGAAARIAAARHDMRAAARLLDVAFRGVDLATTDLTYRSMHRTAAQVYEALGDPKLALVHAKAFQRLEGEAQKLVSTNAAQLMAARFDFASQNLEISRLKQQQLARDVAAERERSRARDLLFGGLSIAGACVLAVLLFAFFAARRGRDALRSANAELEKALAAKTEFLATTSHEIRTPLNGILGMTQVLLADSRVDPHVRERIEVVHGAGETMKALVDDILDVAKMESGELTVASEPTDLRRILEDAARLWSGQAEAKGLVLDLDIASCPRRIVGDGARLRQITFNLMSNAIKFTARGRVALFAGAEPGKGGERLVIRVVDTGIGIPPDKQAQVFEAFRQVDSGTTRQFGGTGLGLAICRQLALAMDGDIAVESAPGQGSRFTVTLPLIRAEPETAVESADAGQDSLLAAARFLLVDRDLERRDTLRHLVAREAEAVATSEDLELALAMMDPGEVTHLLLDAGDLSAAALRDAIAAADGAGALSTLLIDPAAAGVTVAEAMIMGASQLVVRPIGAADLLAAIKSLYGEQPDGFVAPALTGLAA